MKQKRYQSPVVWGAIAAQALAILVSLGAVDTGLSDTLNTLVVSVLQVLVALGVLNNPTDGEAF